MGRERGIQAGESVNCSRKMPTPWDLHAESELMYLNLKTSPGAL